MTDASSHYNDKGKEILVNANNYPKPGRDGTWGMAARAWAEVQEGTMAPIFETVLNKGEAGPGKSVRDVGCGTGLLLVMAREMGATVAGLDASAMQLEVARERLPGADIRLGEMEELPFEGGQFDLVTCCML